MPERQQSFEFYAFAFCASSVRKRCAWPQYVAWQASYVAKKPGARKHDAPERGDAWTKQFGKPFDAIVERGDAARPL